MAEFIVSPVIGPAPLTVTCVNLTEPITATMNWMFSDGGISNDINPVHIFQIPGLYSIVLIAVNSSGASEMIYEYIEVTGPPPPPPPLFPPGPEEMQYFSMFGSNETVVYTEGIETEFDVSIHVEEDGVPGTPSQIGGWGISMQWSDDFVVATEVVWSDYIMSINNGAGPDLAIGGMYNDYNEINVGCIANISAPFDWWYLPPTEPMEVIRVTFETVPSVLLDQTATIDFNIGDSLVTPNTSTVVVIMPTTGAASASIGNGHLLVNNWQVILQPQP
jgi:PKD repeat protein